MQILKKLTCKVFGHYLVSIDPIRGIAGESVCMRCLEHNLPAIEWPRPAEKQ